MEKIPDMIDKIAKKIGEGGSADVVEKALTNANKLT
jgi:hypothetical protein